MRPISLQRNVFHFRQLWAQRRAQPNRVHRQCEVASCLLPCHLMSPYCVNHAKQLMRHGSAYHNPIEKSPEYRATYRAVWPLVDGRYRAIKPMLTELRGLLVTLPPAPRQGSTRGMKPKELAKAILWHIWKQRNHRSTRAKGITPERLILVAAIAAECTPKPCSSPQYRKTQVARAIYRVLRTERRELHGRKFRVKISMQGKWTKQRLFELVEPIYRYELERIRGQVQSGERVKRESTQTC